MDEFKILFCIRVDGDIRSIYALSESEISLMHLDQPQSLEDLELFETVNSIEADLKGNCSACVPYNTFNVNLLEIKPFIEVLESSKYNRKCLYYGCRNKAVELNRSICKKSAPLHTDKFIAVINSRLNDSYVIDYAWGWRLCRDCQIGIERECAAAWLSTLGGAFSALGDYDQKFASMAFYTSMQQIRLARISEDENGIARGWLFLALALSQLGFGRYPRILLHRAWEYKSTDTRHKNMCLGVQAKLKYDRKQRKLAKQFGNRGKDLRSGQRRELLEMLKTLKV